MGEKDMPLSATLITPSGTITSPFALRASIKILFTITRPDSAFALFESNQGVPKKAFPPIVVTLSGIFIFNKFSQNIKAELSIVVTFLGIIISVKLLQLPKADGPIIVTLSGILISDKPLFI